MEELPAIELPLDEDGGALTVRFASAPWTNTLDLAGAAGRHVIMELSARPGTDSWCGTITGGLVLHRIRVTQQATVPSG